MATEQSESLLASVPDCMLCDQHRLRQRIGAMRPRTGGRTAQSDSMDKIAADIERSMKRRTERLLNRPSPTFPDDLPVAQRRAEIAQAIAAHQVVILCGETGSGKTTQLPKICLELGRGIAGLIGHTQPRRIAARTIAMRIAGELQSPLGHAVGYKVRFTDRVGSDGYIKVMTDGILLAETQRDRFLTQYDTIIIDEAHERSLNIDLLLGYLKQMMPKRPELKVIITSATIDPQRFSRHFDDAPIIEVSGRVHPVEVRYRPVKTDEPDEEDPTVLEAILRAVDELTQEKSDDQSSIAHEPGDVLVFLSGEREIREAAEALRKHHPSGTEVLPLYARLSVEDQNRVFRPHAGRRIVLATNVAETSLTVPGIRYVIDPGFARISRYSANARVQRLPVEPVSQASANQRKGRCGRIGPGVCIRLFSQEDFDKRSEYTDPEILRANLASVILQMKALRLGDVERFPFIDRPRAGMIREGYQTLLELGAVDDRGRLTKLGVELAKLPVDPRIGRMILAARQEQCLREVLIIAAALAAQDARLRPMDAAAAADAAHEAFIDEQSDFLSYLKLWDFYHEQARHLSTNKLRKLCQQRYLSYLRLREWHDVHQQLHALVTESGMKVNDSPASPQAIHRALLTGLLNNVGTKSEGHEYLGPRERRFHIFPGSALFKKTPKWIMAAELVETTRLYARIAGRIHPEWIERSAAHVLKRTHSDPLWNEATAHVEAFERVTLHGLVIVPRRRIHFGQVNPTQAREIFINQGLVQGAMPTPFCEAPYFKHNRRLMNEIRAMEAKRRRRNVMVGEQAVFDFYDRRIPPAVNNGPSLDKWRREAEALNPTLLFMSRDDIVRSDATVPDAQQFPDAISMNGVRVPLDYQFDPGGAMDGVTAMIPLEALNQIDDRTGQWLVPGMLRERIEELIRTLPKTLRREFVPVADHAEWCAQVLPFGKGDLLESLGRELHRRVGVEIPHDAWRPELLPECLRMNFAVIDSQGKTIAAGRDLTQIKRGLARKVSQAVASAAQSDFERSGLTTWSFGDLPARIEINREGFTMYGYPAIVDDDAKKISVSLRVLDTEHAAGLAHRAGVVRLFALAVKDELAAHIDYLPDIDQLGFLSIALGHGDDVKQDLADRVVGRVYVDEAPTVRSQTEFERRLRSGWDRLWPAVREASDLTARILAAHQAIDLQLADASNPLWAGAISDIRRQIKTLLEPHFIARVPHEWLQHYPRYLAAVQARLRKLFGGDVARDAATAKDIEAAWNRYEPMAERNRIHAVFDPALEQYRWMVEEYRVSLFAQELGTMFPVSAKRLHAQWETVRRPGAT